MSHIQHSPAPRVHRYNVLGHAKFVGILIGGFVLFGDPLSTKVLTGMAVTCCGLWMFSYFKMFPPNPKKEQEEV